MAVFDLELARCLVQQGSFSMSAASHRRLGGDPKIEITNGPLVQWRVYDLDQGVPRTTTGLPAADGVDIYFLVENAEYARALLSSFPATSGHFNAAHIRPPVNPTGTERPGGKRIRPMYPIAAFAPIARIQIQHTTQMPYFQAEARNEVVYVEYELTPIKGYGSEMIELHFGVRGTYTVSPCAAGGSSQAVIEMEPSVYATVVAEILRLI